MNKEGKTSRMTSQQREVMLAFMKGHENYAKGKISNLGPDGARVKANLVKDLAAELNSLPNGATKSGEKWMKSWQDWRSDVKSKAAKIKKSLTGTGGGPPTKLALTPLEEELMAFLGQVVAEGLPEVTDPLEAQVSLQALDQARPSTSTMVWEEVVGNLIFLDDVASASVIQRNPSPIPEKPQQSAPVATPSLPGKGRKRKHTRSEGPSSSKEVPDKLLKLSEEQNQLLRRKIELKEEMVALQRQSLAIQERQAAAIDNAATSFTDTMKIVQDAIKKWLDKE